ncbi:ArnT family glycosyltransferase [Candidatus Omnitrophota bacterium]
MMKRITVDILFLLLIVVHIIVHIVLLGDFSIDDISLAAKLEGRKDCRAHQSNIQKAKQIIKGEDDYSLREIINVHREYPPLFHYLMASLALFFPNKEYYVIRCGALLFSVLIFFLLYGYFRRKNDPLIGFWAVLLTACCPFFLMHSTATTPHVFMSLCILFLFVLSERTDNFRNWRWSLFFGIMSGVCLFAKQEMFIYCFALYSILAIPVILKPTKQQIGNLVISLCLFGNFFAYFFYCYIYNQLGHLFRSTVDYSSYPVGSYPQVPYEVFSYYGKMLFSAELLGIYIGGIACVATVIHFIKPHLRKEQNIIFFCVISLVIFTVIFTKCSEYISPLIPFIAIICARGISVIRFRVVQMAVVIIICCLTVNTYAEAIIERSLCSIDATQFEYGKIWDMVEGHITRDTADPIVIQVCGVKSGTVIGYILLRSEYKGYRNIWMDRISDLAYSGKENIDTFTKIPLFIYITYSEKDSWPTQEELWDKFKQIHLAESNVVSQDWQKVVDSKDLFTEIAREQMILEGEIVHVFLYENRERNKEKEL